MAKDPQTLTLSTDVDSDIWPVNEDGNLSARRGTRADLRDMMRMGKRQELSRNFGFLSIVGIISIGMGTWGATISTNPSSLADGGMANLFWTYIIVFFCWCCAVASMCEMASMAPTSGGQYHWVSEFAPPRAARLLSYLVGWASIISWQLAFFGSSALAEYFQDIFILTGSNFTFTSWQSNLLIIAASVIAVAINTNIGNSLSLFGGATTLLNFCCFFLIIIPLLVLAPRTDPQTVFLGFSNQGDSGSFAQYVIFGVIGPTIDLMAPDVAVHMSEEVKNSSTTVPRAMMTGVALNGILGLLGLIVFCFTAGDLNVTYSSGVSARTQSFFNATNSVAATIGMTTAMEILLIAGQFVTLISASRLLFAFARDRGVPYASFVSYVRPGWKVPFNAIMITFCSNAFLALISMASDQIMVQLYSIAVSGLFFSYIASIGCVRLKRWRNEPLPSRPWSLGRWGAPINDIALIFLIFTFVLFYLPSNIGIAPTTANNMNYAVIVFVGMLLFALLFYYVKGRHVYVNPSTLVRNDF